MQASGNQSTKAIGIFIFFTFALSSIYYAILIHIGKLGAGNGTYVVGLMYCPALSAFITCKILKRKISTLGWGWGKPRYQLWAYLVPLLYTFVAYLIIWLTGWGGFYDVKFVKDTAASFGWSSLPDAVVIVLYFIFMAIYGIIRNMSTALGEEIGWRGFLMPELAKNNSYTKTSLIVGCIWAVWHFPILIFGDYNNGAPAWIGLTCFTVMVISISFVFTWFRLKSNSLWTGVMLHASHNLFVQRFFTPMTAVNAQTKYYIDEFGVVLPAICVLVAIYFWTRRGELVKPAATDLPEADELNSDFAFS